MATSVRIEVLDAETLFDRVYTEAANADLLERDTRDGKSQGRLKYLFANMINDDDLITLYRGERIAGMAQVGRSPYNRQILWVKFVSVETGEQGRGLARLLIAAIYEYAVERSLKVEPSSFTEQGQRLKHIFSEFDERFPAACAGLPHRDM